MCKSIKYHLHIYCVLTTQSPASFYHHIFDPLYPLHLPPTPSPSGNHLTVCVYEFVFSFVAIWVKPCGFCPFPSDLFLLVWYSQDLFMLSQMARFHPFYGCVVFHCVYGIYVPLCTLYICTTSSLSSHLSEDTLVVSRFWPPVNNAVMDIRVHKPLQINVFKIFR